MSVNLTELYDQVIAAKALKKGIYVPKNIGVGRLGVCARQTVLMFDPKVKRAERTIKEIKNKERMFKGAKDIEVAWARVYHNLGFLFSYNSWLTYPLPIGVNGQLDFLLYIDGKWYLIEFKTSHPNSFQHSKTFPKSHHVWQAKGYVYALAEMGINVDEYCVFYVPQGGQAQPIEKWFKADIPVIKKEVEAGFSYLKGCKAAYEKDGTMPPVVERELKYRKAKDVYEVKMEANWQCNTQYCVFSSVSCEPNMSNNKVATVNKDGSITVQKKYEDMTKNIVAFVKTQT